jgi:KDO2-lipid IV(A) lauroyltransferase
MQKSTLKRKFKPIRKKVKYAVLYPFFQLLLWQAAFFPRRWTLALYRKLGLIAYHLFPKQRALVTRHYNYAFDKQMSAQEAIAFNKKLFANIATNAADLFIANRFHKLEDYQRWIDYEGMHHIEQAYQEGNGVIVLTCHMGAFDLIGSILAVQYPTNIIVRELHNPKLNSLLLRSRTRLGAKIFYSGDNMLKVVRHLHQGEIVILLIDQDIKRLKGVFVDFFGKPAYTPIGATWLALNTEAKVIPMAIRQKQNRRHQVTVSPPVPVTYSGDRENDLQENTARFSLALEQLIKLDLTQWAWMHRRWKTKPKDLKSNILQ